MGLAANRCGEGQGEVDPRRHAASGDAIAVEDNALGHRFGAEQGKLVAPGPVAGGAVAAEQPGGAEDERAGAHARHPLRVGGDGADPGEGGVVLHHVDAGDAAGNAEDVGAPDLVEGGGWEDGEAGVGRHRLPAGRDEVDGDVAESREELRRPGEVELSDSGVEEKGDG